MKTVKEKLVEFIRKDGYDFITACEHAEAIIKEFIKSGIKSQTYFSKHSNRQIRLERN